MFDIKSFEFGSYELRYEYRKSPTRSDQKSVLSSILFCTNDPLDVTEMSHNQGMKAVGLPQYRLSP